MNRCGEFPSSGRSCAPWIVAATGVAVAAVVWGVSAPLPARADAAPLDGELTFRDLRFGAPLQAVAGLVAVETQGPGRVCYERPDDDLRLGAATLRSLRYCFDRGRFTMVQMAVSGPQHADALLAWFETRFGRGRRERGAEDVRRIVWEGRIARAYFGEARGPQTAQAQIWLRDAEDADARPGPPRGPAAAPKRPMPPHGRAADVAPPRAAGDLQVGAPRRVRRGLVAQVSLRYRGLAAPGAVIVYLPRELVVQSSVPTAQVFPDHIVWEGLQAPAGQLKFKALVPADVMAGAVIDVHAELRDAAGGRTRASGQMRAQ